MPFLFSYGSLRSTEVQRSTFGRAVRGEPDSLPGFVTLPRAVADARGTITTVLPSPHPGAAVAGVALEVTEAELAVADAYESPDSYGRIAVMLASGRRSWVYLELDATRSRIVFPGNPWPDGHAVRHFAWRARRHGGRLRFLFELNTAEYDADAPGTPGEEEWTAPLAWRKHGRCTISADRWHAGGFEVDEAIAATAAAVDGRVFLVDDPPPADRASDAFQIHLLGRDACARHRIAFHRIAETDRCFIDWRGRIALAHAGDDTYRHRFVAMIHGARLEAA